ncbi:hypothetical protein F5Y03DRAFT_208220 [Xylaria venustula]|nr:hypothetical protein F5Y03DRAFT_208220 [Xylaria venustula]
MSRSILGMFYTVRDDERQSCYLYCTNLTISMRSYRLIAFHADIDPGSKPNEREETHSRYGMENSVNTHHIPFERPLRHRSMRIGSSKGATPPNRIYTDETDIVRPDLYAPSRSNCNRREHRYLRYPAICICPRKPRFFQSRGGAEAAPEARLSTLYPSPGKRPGTGYKQALKTEPRSWEPIKSSKSAFFVRKKGGKKEDLLYSTNDSISLKQKELKRSLLPKVNR